MLTVIRVIRIQEHKALQISSQALGRAEPWARPNQLQSQACLLFA